MDLTDPLDLIVLDQLLGTDMLEPPKKEEINGNGREQNDSEAVR